MEITSGKRKLVRDISANTLQTIITQGFGVIIFYLTSKFLVKTDFGEFNWSLAVGSTIIAIASLGLDLVYVKKIASGADVLVMSGIHFFHTVITGLVLSTLAFIVHVFIPVFTDAHPVFFFVFLNLALANVANSFKLCLNGLESYKRLAWLALVTNSIKLGLIFYLYVSGKFNIMNVVIAYTLTSAVEFLAAYFLMSKAVATTVKPVLKIDEYKYFIMESLPQLGVVLFDSALARIDWILLGILSTSAVTADYSFTYKVFELSKLPLLIVAPVLLTRFSKVFSKATIIPESQKKEIDVFFKLELFIVMLIPIILVCTWSPLVDFFTNNKYGAVNEVKFWILAACIPILCIINFLWTLGFVQGQLKEIFFITIVTSVLNIIGNLILIPLYAGEGAALAFFICTVLQMLLYARNIKQDQVKPDFLSMVILLVLGAVSILAASLLTNNLIFKPLFAMGMFVLLAILTRQINLTRLKNTFRKSAFKSESR